MSLALVISCDRAHHTGTCAAQLHTGTAVAAEARAVAVRAGWESWGDQHFCPGHAARPRRPPPPADLFACRTT
ncbi:hypothetical protein [Streptomyces sp. NPDC008125]|uniref:hypothetical protein n=1 Tax=Streptomyces sp. NPDC008125 TaxID=3364811 RepID=UPI0036E6CF04